MPPHRSVLLTFLPIYIFFCAVSLGKYVHVIPQNSFLPRKGESLVDKYSYRAINLYAVTTTEPPRIVSSASTSSTSTTTLATPERFINGSSIEGRGKHPFKIGHKKKKALKHLYPFIIAFFTAKSILIPLILKTIIMLSKSAFILSSLSFLASIVMGIKILLLHSWHHKGSESTKVEVVHVPIQQKYGHYSGWVDRESENKFIPITSPIDSYYADNDKSASTSYGYK